MNLKFSNKIKSNERIAPLSTNNNCIQMGFRLTCSTDSDIEYDKVEIQESMDRLSFQAKYEYWKHETMASSHLNINNVHIKDIAINKEVYIPFMYEDLKGGNYDIVKLLELIMPEMINYSGLITRKQASKRWLKILQLQMIR